MMEKIFKWLGNIPSDKALHYIAGLIIVAVLATFFPKAADHVWLGAVILGFGKEIYDLFTDSKFDFVDFGATVLGGLTIQILIWVAL